AITGSPLPAAPPPPLTSLLRLRVTLHVVARRRGRVELRVALDHGELDSTTRVRLQVWTGYGYARLTAFALALGPQRTAWVAPGAGRRLLRAFADAGSGFSSARSVAVRVGVE